jgi:cytochrome c oxidase cbb3-type subunit II
VKSNFAFFVGLFGALLLSWAGIVLGSNAQLGSLAPYYDDTENSTFPAWMPGEAARGQLVYKDLGCAACHTQQVRRPGFGSDKERGWGDRQSVARDYIYQPAPQLGLRRIGPDLANLGDRKPSAPDADDVLHLLYAGSDGMPSYRFLFEEHLVGVGAQRSSMALDLVGKLEPKAGWEVVPTPRAQALAAYLVSLKNSYDYPEAVPVAPPKGESEASKAAAPAPATGAAPAPAAAAGGKPTPAPSAGGTPAPAGPGAAAPKPASGSPTPAPSGAAPAPAAGTPAPAAGAATPAPASGSPTPAPSGAAPAPAAATPAPAAGAATPAPAAGSPTPAPSGATATPPSGTPAPSGGAATPAPASGSPTPAPSGAAPTPAAGTPAPAAGAPTPAPAAGAAAPATPTPSKAGGTS